MEFHKKKWAYQARQRAERNSYGGKRGRFEEAEGNPQGNAARGLARNPGAGTLGAFLRRAQRTLLDTPWQIIQVFHFESFIC